MAISVGTTYTAKEDADDNSLSIASVVVAAGDSVIVCGGAEDASATDINISGITMNGQSFTSGIGAEVTNGNTNRSEIWHLHNVTTSGTYSVALTFTGNTSNKIASATVVTGMKNQAPEATNSGSSTSADTLTTNITTLTNGSIIFACIAHAASSGTWTQGGSQTEILDDVIATGVSVVVGASYKIFATAGATSMQQTLSPSTLNRVVQVVAAYAPSSAAVKDIISNTGMLAAPRG